MLLLPVGHEDTVVRRLPWVTIVIVGLCTLLQVRACVTAPAIDREYESIDRRIVDLSRAALAKHDAIRSVGKHGDGVFDVINEKVEDMQFVGKGMQRQAHRMRAFQLGELLPADDPLYIEYLELKEERDAILARHPVAQLGYRPATGGLMAMLMSIFAHGGWFHLIGNMWFLYLVGCNLEDRWGRSLYAAFFVLGGVVAAVSYASLHSDSEVFLVGASGAVSAAMGAFLVCYTTTKINFYFFYFFFRRIAFSAPAWLMLPLWVLEQGLMVGLETQSGVAHSAHVGGFVYGFIVALTFRQTGLDAGLNEELEALSNDGEVWTEDPEYLAALEATERGESGTALRSLQAALRDNPDRPEIHNRIFDLALEMRDAAAAGPSLSWLLRHAHAAHHSGQVATLFRRLHTGLPHHVLTAEQLSWVTEAARRESDAATVVHATGMMLQRYGESPLLPRAMWLTAEMQQQHSKRELVRDTLGRLVRRFPQDPIAKQARARLAELDGGGSPA